ncbi:MAG TPA: peptidoglycan-binding protein [Xanthobacteraceae bacterium]|nr:peptidoglycan-binding protein [Xanthobacteraceae bacterium]
MAPSFEDLKAEYADLWRRMQVRPEREAEVDRLARTLLGLKPRYDEVAHTTGVPWFVIAVLHRRESDGDFRTYLGNGEPLNRRTRIEPIGRGPFPTWEAGAIDALQFDGLDKVREWTPERACYEIEKFNGFGYRNKNVKSPYLWSFSNIYDRGKFVADHQFSFSAVDQQCGAMPILKRMMELDPSVRFEGATDVVMVDDGSLAMGSIGERVGQLQAGLAQLGFAVGDIDSEFGPITSAAVSAFQSAHGLSPTGIADQATQHALASALGQGPAGPTEPLKSQDILGALLSALLAKARAAPPRVPGPAPTDAPGDVLQLILRALASGQPAPAPGGVAPPSVGNAPILSPIDKMLGGQALAGKKTALSVVAYVVLAILQAAGVIGVATPAGQILTVLIAAFGALGGVSKIDRVIQELGIIAAKVPRAAIPRQ